MKSTEGFTIIELIVVVLLIGILTTLSVSRYRKSVESGDADEAVHIVQELAAGQRRMMINHADPNGYRNGLGEGVLTNPPYPDPPAGCGAMGTVCPNVAPGTHPPPCALVACGYISQHNWDANNYMFALDDFDNTPPCSALVIACARRKPTGSIYDSWGYNVDINGNITAVGGAPSPR